MSRIDDLIREYCPEGVRFVEVGSVATCIAGATPSSTNLNYWEGGTIPWMSSGEVNKKTIFDTDKKITKVGFESCSTKMIPARSVVIALAGQGKTRGLVARTRIELCTNQSLCAIVVGDKLDHDFLYFFLSSQYEKLRNLSSGDGSRGGLNLQMIRSYRIPLPPLEVQREIVRILDEFTALEAELEAELEARRKQYEHYRRLLFIQSKHGETKQLGEVLRIRNGKDHKHLAEGEIPVYGSGGVMRQVDTASACGPSVLIPRKGSLGNLFYVEGPFWNVDTIFSTEIDSSVIEPKFLFHQLSTLGLAEMNQAGGVPSQTQSVLNRLPVSVPPIDEQRRIVKTLDAFDALVNDISIGLPAELAARRKQYEYYRDKLLTFKELTP